MTPAWVDLRRSRREARSFRTHEASGLRLAARAPGHVARGGLLLRPFQEKLVNLPREVHGSFRRERVPHAGEDVKARVGK
jgi:hypothetical protein